MNRTPDDAPASRLAAALAVTIIDKELLLKPAARAVCLTIVAQGRSASGNGIHQHIFDRLNETRAPCRAPARCQTASIPIRRELGTVKRFRDVDVAEPRDDTLIHEQSLQINLLSGGTCR